MSAPTQVTPINNPTDQGDIDDKIGDAYKNADGRCPPAVEGGGFHDTCVAAAPSPDFEEQMGAEGSLMGLEMLGSVGDTLSPLLEFLDPTADIRACADGDMVSCSLMVAGVFPFGKFGRLGRMIDDLPGTGGGAGSSSKGGGPGTPHEGDIPNPAETPDLSSLAKLNDAKLKSYVGNVHAFKESLVGKRGVGRYDVYVDKSSGYLFLRDKYGGDMIPTYHHKDWGPEEW